MFIEQPEQMSVDGAGLASMFRGLLLHLALVLAPFMGGDDRGRHRRPCAAEPARL